MFLHLRLYQHASSSLSCLASTGSFFFVSFLILFPPSIILLSNSALPPPTPAPHRSLLSFLPSVQKSYARCGINPDHTRKIELVRYLMSGYVNGKVLDTLSEHANALASSAVASLEDEADQLSHFLFLPLPSDHVLIVPRHHGWYSRHLRSVNIRN